jgi:hypothetical protein
MKSSRTSRLEVVRNKKGMIQTTKIWKNRGNNYGGVDTQQRTYLEDVTGNEGR